MIAIVDYGMGNLRSVQKAFEKLVAQPLEQFEQDFHRYLLALREE